MKRNAFLRLLAIVAILPISTTMKAQGADDDASARLEIMVGSEREFLDAIGNERTIILREGTTLNLTNVLDNESLFNKSGRAFISEGANISKATIVSQEVVDGRQLTLANLHDLTISGERNCKIIVEPRYSFILDFVNCRNISIECLTLGHTEEGTCMGGVVSFKNCDVATIESCDMYGCGTYGIEADKSEVLRVYRSIIRDCSYGIMVLRDVKDAIFISCDFYRNREFGLVNISETCRQILFDDCRFAQNNGLLFALQSEIELYDCEIHHKGEYGNIEDFNKGPIVDVQRDDNPLSERNIGPAAAIQ